MMALFRRGLSPEARERERRARAAALKARAEELV